MKEEHYISGDYYCGRCLKQSPIYKTWQAVYDWIVRHQCEEVSKELL